MKRILATTSLLLTVGLSCLAQEFATSFFLGNYTYDYKLNPGAPLDCKDHSFASFGLGNISASLPTNLSYEKLAPTIDGQPYWALDSRVPADLFVSKLKKNNFVSPSLNLNLFSFGKKTDSWRFNVEINARSVNSVRVPLEAFSAIKYALEKTGTYGFTSPLTVSSSNYLEFAVGYGFKIGERVTLGFRLKALAGLAGANLKINTLTAGENEDGELLITADGKVNVASHMLRIGTVDSGSIIETYDLQSARFGYLGLEGYGGAVDIGVSVDAFPGFTAGFSALDVGAMYWNYTSCGTVKYERQVINDWNGVIRKEVSTSERTMLPFNLHLFTKYKMPFYDKWNVGMVATFQQYFQEVRIGTGITPVDFISLGLSAAYNSCGFDTGASLGINFPGMNIFAGLTLPLPLVFNKDFIPVKGGINNLTIGITLAI